jgi:hypothetical protein
MENVNTEKNGLIDRIHALENEIANLEQYIECCGHFGAPLPVTCSYCGKEGAFKGMLFAFASANEVADRAAKKQQECDRKQSQLTELRARLANIDSPGVTAKLTWTGTKRELGDWIFAAKIEASSQMNVLEQVITHVEMKDGSALSARNLWQSLKNREDYEGKS